VDIRAVLSNDIVGDPTGTAGRIHRDHVRVFSADLGERIADQELDAIRQQGAVNDSPSRQLARYVETVAHWHGMDVRPKLVFRRDRFLRGGDHTAFNRAGFAAVRLTEVEENYDRQHQDPRTDGERVYGDVPEHVDPEYLAGVARVDAAALAHLANAPSPPGDARIVATELTTDTLLRWTAAPEPDVAGYEVVWRDTTSPRWDHARDVGTASEATLPLGKDDLHFGVRAYDRDGYRSPVVYPAVER
jgi:hypothetical protein